jgi:type I restriction enzyme M protein
MGNAGRNGGEYYTPRPLIRAIIQVVKPKIGERIYDGACGSCGFLCESFEYLTRDRHKLSTKDWNTLQTKTLYAKEKKSLAYVIGIMNMILHGIEAPNIVHTNTLAENISDIQDKDRFDVVLTNPPFGGKERPEVQQNFPIKTGETAYLFLQHFVKSLKAGGRAGIVIRTLTPPRWRCAKSLWRTATCTPCWTCRAARSKALASKPWCCSSRKVRRRGKSGSTSWMPAAISARRTPSTTMT